MATSTKLTSALVPQADNLANLRRIVDAIAEGATKPQKISAVTEISGRHVSYGIRSARTLGLVRADGELLLTASGAALHQTRPGGLDERELLRLIILQNDVLKLIAPGLLSERPPKRDQLSERIARITGMSIATAVRRAGTLLSWRNQLLGTTELPFASAERETTRVDARLTATSHDTLLPDSLVRDIRRTNPWWEGDASVPTPKTQRDFVEVLAGRLKQKIAPIVVVRGPRQVGKTTAQHQIIDSLLRRSVPPSHILRVQCDDIPSLRGVTEPILRIVEWYERTVLRSSLNAVARRGKPTYLFFDEVQNLPDWSVQLKHLVDGSATQVVVTGSSALRIEEGKDSLAGRISSIEVGTLTLREIAQIRFGVELGAGLRADEGSERLISSEFWTELAASGQRQRRNVTLAFDAFSERGGYPLVHKNPEVPWAQLARQLNETVVKRVIQHDLRIGERGRKRDSALLEELLRMACRYAGQAPTAEFLARQAQSVLSATVGTQRIRHYLDFLDRTLLLRLVRPLEIRLKRSAGAPKLCLADHGVRAAWLQETIPLSPSALSETPTLADLAGRIAESVVGSYLLTVPQLELAHFPARANEPEVDFVITIGTRRIPVEVKYRRAIHPTDDTKGLRYFLDKPAFNAPFGLLITQSSYSGPLDPRVIPIPLSSMLLLR